VAATKQQKISTPDIPGLLEAYEGNAYPAMREHLATHLGVSADSLRRLALGWAPIVEFKKGKNFTGWWAIPERDDAGEPIGISLRSQNDMKVMLPGSKHGLIFEVNPEHERGSKGYEAGPHNWIRTMDAGVPCPICKRPDGCILSAEDPADPKAVICIREKSGAAKPMKFGYLHIRKPEGQLTGRSALADNGGPVIVVEGMSDAAAAMDLGYNSVGRPSNLACMDMVANLVRGRSVIIVGENDKKADGKEPGREGMITAYQAVRNTCRDVKTVMPPDHIKDLRAWRVKYGLTRDQFEAYVAQHAESPDLPAITDKRASQAESIIESTASDEFFHNVDIAYVRASVVTPRGVRREVFALDEQGYLSVLARRQHSQYSRVPNAQALNDARNALRGKAMYEGPETEVHVRKAYNAEANEIYLDLADDERTQVRITAAGWDFLSDEDSPIYFIRPRGLQALPRPTTGGKLSELRPLLNLATEKEFVLVCSWLLSLFLPSGTLPMLAINGPQGSGKSTCCRIVRRLFDPNEADLRTPPKDDRDLLISARNAGILAFDNFSSLPPALADTFCRISSGSGFSTRQLYTNSGETLISVRRPILLNGIPTDLVSREDARDRTIVVSLSLIDASKRQREVDLWETFDRICPSVLGALLTAVSKALSRWRSIRLDHLPRMSDFVQWVVAAEPQLPWPPGMFLRAYTADRNVANAVAVENSVVGSTIVQLLAHKPTWSGTCLELLGEVNRLGDGRAQGRFDWPRSAKAISNDLDRILPALNAAGVKVQRVKRNYARLINLSLASAS
jgi:hypothetical protein